MTRRLHRQSPFERISETQDRYPPATRLSFDEEGQLHSEADEPAVVTPDGYRSWYWHGKLDRGDGPAVIDGHYRAWYQMGLLHRDGGPARIWPDGSEAWYQMGMLHRENGPALVAPEQSGGLYFIYGKHISAESYSRKVTKEYGPMYGPPAPDYSAQYAHDFD